MTIVARGADYAGHFDLCIIGSGSGLSLVDDDINDWRIALIDAGIGPIDTFGGTCLNAGCIPSKMLVLPARWTLAPGEAKLVDVDVAFRGADFKAIQARTFGRTDAIAESGLAGLVARENVTVFRGEAVFTDPHTIRVGGQELSADRIVLAAGSRPRIPDVPGFDDPYLSAFVHTSEDIMRIEELPEQLTIIGGGVEAVEFGHIFAGMGVKVQIIARSAPLMRRLDDEVAELLTAKLGQRAVLQLNQQLASLEPGDEGGVVITTTDAHGIEYSYASDAVLVCVGRIPNGDQLRLDAAGISLDEHGFVPVDEHQRTAVPHIWALGDICAPDMLKHLANQQARVVKANLLAERDGTELVSTDERFVPYGIFGEPEVAGFGPSERELVAAGVPHVSYTQQYKWVAYGWALNDQEHFVKLVGDLDGRVLGAQLIGPQASTLIQPILMGLAQGLDAQQMARGQYWIHPSLSEVVENALLGLARLAREARQEAGQ